MLKVLKFGGSSVGSAPALRRAAAIVNQELPEGGLVVVSALQGTTDRLLEAAAAAGRGEGARARDLAEAIRAHHQEVAFALGLGGHLEGPWSPLLARLGSLLEGLSLLGECSPRSRDAVLALGETLSAQLFAALLAQEGRPAAFRDVREVMATDGRHGRARPRLAALRRAAAPWRQALLGGARWVTQGFLGQGPDGAVTTLGRGGSDTTATLLGEALGAQEVQIWTDVDGVLSADPGLVPEARPLSVLSVAEASALSAFGAKVLHADCLAPAHRAGYRLIVANTLRPEASRTWIRPYPEAHPSGPLSVAYKEGLSLLRWPPEARLEEILTALAALEEAGAQRFGLLSLPEGTLLALRPEGATPALQALEEEGVRVEEGWAVVALVGEALREAPEPSLRALLGQTPAALLRGTDSVSAAALFPEARLREIIPALHRLCLEPAALAAP